MSYCLHRLPTLRPFQPRRAVVIATLLIAFGFIPVSGEERVDADVAWRIRREAVDRSQITETLHLLTDVYGPRLTGSPNLKAASEWAVQQMTAWGLMNARLEPWEFGHPGWVNERFAAYIVSPVQDSLVGEVVAWTPGTTGALTGQTVHISPPARPTQAELTAWFDATRADVKGRIVLVGRSEVVPVSFNPVTKRRDESEVRATYDPVNPAPSPYQRMMMNRPEEPKEGPRRLSANEVSRQIDAWLRDNGALARVGDAGREHGQVRAFANRTYDIEKAVPGVVLRNEDYGRIARLLADGRNVGLELTMANRLVPEGRTQYNVLAEMPGTDKADEVVMLGAHLDSWHSATGATDNAVGAAIVMEAVRILQASGVKPRRTIRLALWSGEEQGLLGSRAYVSEHFGTFEKPKPGYSKLAAYFNIDSGTGRARGMSVFGPPEAAAVVRAALAPFADLGVVGTVASKSRRRGGSDHTSFSEAGLPGIAVGQDPIEYISHTWHTNLDTYERIVPEDARASAIAVAFAVCHLAMRDEPLPRFPAGQMPEPAPSEEEDAAPVRQATPVSPTSTRSQ